MQLDFEGYQVRRATALVALVVAVLVPTATAGASTLNASTAAPAPSVLAVSATPTALSFHGGTVTVNGRVRNAATCQQRLLSHQNFVVVFANNSRRCSSTFSAHVTIGANPTTVPRTVAFELIARKGNKSSARRFFITVGPGPVLHVTRAALRSSGGALGRQDTFARANGSLGPEWTSMTGGGLSIVNQAVEGTNAGGNSGDIRTGEPYTSDQFSQVQVASTPLSGNQWTGPAVRAQAGGQDLYVGFYFWDNASPELMLFLRDNGNWSQLGGVATSPLAAGTTLSLTAVGSTLAFAVNGDIVVSTSDSTLSGGAPASWPTARRRSATGRAATLVSRSTTRARQTGSRATPSYRPRTATVSRPCGCYSPLILLPAWPTTSCSCSRSRPAWAMRTVTAWGPAGPRRPGPVQLDHRRADLRLPAVVRRRPR